MTDTTEQNNVEIPEETITFTEGMMIELDCNARWIINPKNKSVIYIVTEVIERDIIQYGIANQTYKKKGNLVRLLEQNSLTYRIEPLAMLRQWYRNNYLRILHKP